MIKELKSTVIKAAKGDQNALNMVCFHLQTIILNNGISHARIEAQQFYIYAVTSVTPEQLYKFKIITQEIILN